MSLNTQVLQKLVTPKPGPMTSRLPNLHARKNAALIAGLSPRVTKAKEGGKP